MSKGMLNICCSFSRSESSYSHNGFVCSCHRRRILESYKEFQSPANAKMMERVKLPATMIATIPVTFPQSYPFSLVSKAPAPTDASAGSSSEPQPLFNCCLGETAIVFLVMLHSSTTQHLLEFFENSLSIEGKDNFAVMMSRLFEVSTSILLNDAFPSNWLNVNIFAHKVILRMMEPISVILKRDFIPNQQHQHQFNSTLWRETFYMLLKLLSSDKLVIEDFSPQVKPVHFPRSLLELTLFQRQRAVWRLGGDIRGEGATILLSLWDSLGWPDNTSAHSGSVNRYGASSPPLSLYSHSPSPRDIKSRLTLSSAMWSIYA
jgi:dedicator of cytokinesis protein 3